MEILTSITKAYVPPSPCERNRKQRLEILDIIRYCMHFAFSNYINTILGLKAYGSSFYKNSNYITSISHSIV